MLNWGLGGGKGFGFGFRACLGSGFRLRWTLRFWGYLSVSSQRASPGAIELTDMAFG